MLREYLMSPLEQSVDKSVAMKSKTNSKKYRKACFLRTSSGSELDAVLSYLDETKRPLSSIVEELLLAVYLVPALQETGATQQDVHLAGLQGIGFLDVTAESLRAVVEHTVGISDFRVPKHSERNKTSSEAAHSISEVDRPISDSDTPDKGTPETSIEKMDKYESMI